MTKRMAKAILALALGVLLAGCEKTGTEDSTELGTAKRSTAETVSTETASTETASTETQTSEETGTETVQGTEAVTLNFDTMYSSGSSSRGLQFSEEFQSMDGKTVQISGYMAPPLKPVFSFFVLSKQPMAICPFCSSDADWPEDIVAVYVEDSTKSVANDTLLTVTGTLELGSYTDEETGFVSQARIYAESIVHNR